MVFLAKFFLGNSEFLVLEGVYSPREDSELLAAALKVSKVASVLDMGCGTGIQGLQAILLGAGFVCFADANPKALANARKNFSLLKKQGFNAKAKFVKTNLFSNVKRKFDFIVFNPPYVPSENKKFLDLDGGEKGRDVLDSFLKQAPKFLLPGGKIFFLQSSLNGLARTKKILKEKNLKFRIVARQKLFFEELVVFCAWK